MTTETLRMKEPDNPPSSPPSRLLSAPPRPLKILSSSCFLLLASSRHTISQIPAAYAPLYHGNPRKGDGPPPPPAFSLGGRQLMDIHRLRPPQLPARPFRTLEGGHGLPRHRSPPLFSLRALAWIEGLVGPSASKSSAVALLLFPLLLPLPPSALVRHPIPPRLRSSIYRTKQTTIVRPV